MNGSPISFFIVYPGDYYRRVKPNFVTGKFDPDTLTVSKTLLNIYGFEKRISSDPIDCEDEVNVNKSRDEIRILSFKSFIDNVTKEVRKLEVEAPHVLIGTINDGDITKYWITEADYQLMLWKQYTKE